MTPISKEQVFGRIDSAPDNIRELILSERISNMVREVCASHFLDDARGQQVSAVTGLVILGFIHPEDAAREISERINVNPKIGESIARELNQKIFALFRPDIDAMYKEHALSTAKEPLVDAKTQEENGAPAAPLAKESWNDAPALAAPWETPKEPEVPQEGVAEPAPVMMSVGDILPPTGSPSSIGEVRREEVDVSDVGVPSAPPYTALGQRPAPPAGENPAPPPPAMPPENLPAPDVPELLPRPAQEQELPKPENITSEESVPAPIIMSGEDAPPVAISDVPSYPSFEQKPEERVEDEPKPLPSAMENTTRTEIAKPESVPPKTPRAAESEEAHTTSSVPSLDVSLRDISFQPQTLAAEPEATPVPVPLPEEQSPSPGSITPTPQPAPLEPEPPPMFLRQETELETVKIDDAPLPVSGSTYSSGDQFGMVSENIPAPPRPVVVEMMEVLPDAPPPPDATPKKEGVQSPKFVTRDFTEEEAPAPPPDGTFASPRKQGFFKNLLSALSPIKKKGVPGSGAGSSYDIIPSPDSSSGETPPPPSAS